jgi:DNA polymerase (family X)
VAPGRARRTDTRGPAQTHGERLIFRKRLPSPADVAGALRRLSRAALLRGDAPIAAAFESAAQHAGTLDPKALQAALADPERTFDPAIAPDLAAIAADGPIAIAVAAEAKLPRDLAGLARAVGIDLDALAVDDVHVAADLAAVWHERPADEIAARLAQVRAGHPRLLLGRALGAVDLLRDAMGRAHPALTLHPAGALRRFEPTIGDLLVLASGAEPRPSLAAWADRLPAAEVRRRGRDAVTFQWDGEEITVRAVTDPGLGAALVHYTGSRAHVAQLADRARVSGLRLTPGGLLDASGTLRATASEADLYAALDLPWIPPERRHGLDEIALAERGAFPPGVGLIDIQGDLHTHTLWSDGRDTTEAVVRSARALGYRYLAITDHSPTSKASRTLSIDGIAQQAREIDALRATYPELTILHGCEVDILGDGTLDLPDAVMAGLDIVLASLHDPCGQPPDRLLERYLGAMAHPLVNVITHPANRTPGRANGYALDWDRFFAAARDSGTAVEVDGAPGHLDLDGHLARRAVETGATVVIDSDGHFAERLGRQMRMGIGTAARGGVEARHVLNARSLDAVRTFIADKRRR